MACVSHETFRQSLLDATQHYVRGLQVLVPRTSWLELSQHLSSTTGFSSLPRDISDANFAKVVKWSSVIRDIGFMGGCAEETTTREFIETHTIVDLVRSKPQTWPILADRLAIYRWVFEQSINLLKAWGNTSPLRLLCDCQCKSTMIRRHWKDLFQRTESGRFDHIWQWLNFPGRHILNVFVTVQTTHLPPPQALLPNWVRNLPLPLLITHQKVYCHPHRNHGHARGHSFCRHWSRRWCRWRRLPCVE